MASKTLIDYFLDHASKTPDKIYLTQPMGGDVDNVVDLTFGQVLDQAKRMAAYLQSLDFPAKSQIAICSKNCAWWIIADLAIWFSGHVTVPIYPTLTADTVAYTLEHSESKLVFIGKLDVQPWEAMKGGIPEGMHTVSLPFRPDEWSYTDSWENILSQNEPISKIAVRAPEEMSTIIYTSGSTGKPKGVMQSFRAMLESTKGLVKSINITSKDRLLSYLPMSHSMARWVDECLSLYVGFRLYFAGNLKTFVQDLQRSRPTLFLSVPRLWTKFQQGVSSKMPPEKLDKLLRIPLLNIYVRRKILKGLGLNYCRLAGSGSAPIPAELISWYHKLGLELMEGYGMSETFNYSHMSKKGKSRVGYVGCTYDDVEHRITDIGEILVKTPGCMIGYYKNDAATKETLTEDGWVRTGDKGEVDEKGLLKITGRIKEIFKTSKGKYVAPAPIENKLNIHPNLELSCVAGTAFPQPHAVVQLSEASYAEVKKDPSKKDEIGKALNDLLKKVNSTLDQHEQLAFLAVVSDVWLPENGYLTPTQKIKRPTIESTYKPNLETWYESKEKVIWFGF